MSRFNLYHMVREWNDSGIHWLDLNVRRLWDKVFTNPDFTTSTEDKTYFVDGITGNDNNIGSESKPFKTITHATDLIPDSLNHDFSIIIASGTYSESISIFNISGSGRILIFGEALGVDPTSYVIESALFSAVAAEIFIRGFTLISKNIDYNSALLAVRCTSVSVNTCKTVISLAPETKTGFAFVNCLYSIVSKCQASNCRAALYALNGGTTYSENWLAAGSGNGVGLEAQNGATIAFNTDGGFFQPAATNPFREITGGRIRTWDLTIDGDISATGDAQIDGDLKVGDGTAGTNDITVHTTGNGVSQISLIEDDTFGGFGARFRYQGDADTIFLESLDGASPKNQLSMPRAEDNDGLEYNGNMVFHAGNLPATATALPAIELVKTSSQTINSGGTGIQVSFHDVAPDMDAQSTMSRNGNQIDIDVGGTFMIHGFGSIYTGITANQYYRFYINVYNSGGTIIRQTWFGVNIDDYTSGSGTRIHGTMISYIPTGGYIQMYIQSQDTDFGILGAGTPYSGCLLGAVKIA